MPVNILLNKVAPKVPNNIDKNPPLCSFASSFIVSLTHFNNKAELSKDLTIFKVSSISSFQTIKYLCIPASAADAAAVNPNGTKNSWLMV